MSEKELACKCGTIVKVDAKAIGVICANCVVSGINWQKEYQEQLEKKQIRKEILESKVVDPVTKKKVVQRFGQTNLVKELIRAGLDDKTILEKVREKIPQWTAPDVKVLWFIDMLRRYWIPREVMA